MWEADPSLAAPGGAFQGLRLDDALLSTNHPLPTHLRACRAFLFCRRFSSSMGYSLKSSRPMRMRTMGAMVTSIFSVNLTRAGWEQPRVWYPVKLWGPVVRGVVRRGHLGPAPAQHYPDPHPTHSRLRVEMPRETPEANLVKKT